MTQFRRRKTGTSKQKGKVFPVGGKFTPKMFHAERSAASKLLDNRLKAPITEDAEEWARHPNRFDLDGVDTPKGKSVKVEHTPEELKEMLESDQYRHVEFMYNDSDGAFSDRIHLDEEEERIADLHKSEKHKEDNNIRIYEENKEEEVERQRIYDEKMERKKERYQELAIKNSKAADDTHEQARKMADVIPFGQPILVGHHSEKGDRSYRNKIHNKFDKSFELHNKAKYYEDKVKSIENNYAIRSDDPSAIKQLKEKIVELEKQRSKWKDKDGSLSKEKWLAALEKKGKKESDDYFNRYDVNKTMELTSIGANIRSAKKRIDSLQETRSIPEKSKTINGVVMNIDQSDNRVKLEFPGKPSQEVRTKLKRNGFRWSPTNGVWQRQINNASLYYAEEILKDLK